VDNFQFQPKSSVLRERFPLKKENGVPQRAAQDIFQKGALRPLAAVGGYPRRVFSEQ
jgi:hypothetical protein